MRGPPCLGRGLIPARAGKTRSRIQRASSPPAHPRACGENRRHMHSSEFRSGSSPRVRGKLVGGFREFLARGLIPARAGKTPRSTTTSCPAAAHPRACGENGARALHLLRFLGSSPRVRGKRDLLPRLDLVDRLIPARAGKTMTPGRPRSASTAHPRACGENNSELCMWRRDRGSSPRVRGKPHRRSQLLVRGGLIPARAGKTVAIAVGAGGHRAHPRACGENPQAGCVLGLGPGSSPRVRGKPGPKVRVLTAMGLIPARAGKTGR